MKRICRIIGFVVLLPFILVYGPFLFLGYCIVAALEWATQEEDVW